jgi:hypothetical protein
VQTHPASQCDHTRSLREGGWQDLSRCASTRSGHVTPNLRYGAYTSFNDVKSIFIKMNTASTFAMALARNRRHAPTFSYQPARLVRGLETRARNIFLHGQETTDSEALKSKKLLRSYDISLLTWDAYLTRREHRLRLKDVETAGSSTSEPQDHPTCDSKRNGH